MAVKRGVDRMWRMEGKRDHVGPGVAGGAKIKQLEIGIESGKRGSGATALPN